jgi:hypothetical protein
LTNFSCSFTGKSGTTHSPVLFQNAMTEQFHVYLIKPN